MRKKFIICLIILLITGNIFASSTSAILDLHGTVEEVLSINVTEAPNLEIDANKGFKKKTVSTGTYCSNSLNGFEIAVSSANGGFKEIINSNIIPYTIYFDNNSGILASNIILPNSFILIETDAPSLTVESFKIKIAIANEDALWASGIYKDSLTFILINK